MKRSYDETINKHYKSVAKEHGLASTSSMMDEITRKMETKAILQFVKEALTNLQSEGRTEQLTIIDVGCGNGYTLEQLHACYPDQKFYGIEKSPELRTLASSRFSENDSIQILEGDIRDSYFAQNIEADIVICQRVLINLLDAQDQENSLHNIIGIVKEKGFLLFLECFSEPLDRLNEARDEFDLSAISPAHHNLYLKSDFFNVPSLKLLNTNSRFERPNFLSTHYYVTRILHALFIPPNKSFKRNSEFVKFFSCALNQYSGDYSPLKLYVFAKAQLGN